MTVMQHERGAVGGFSKEAVEDEADVLSCLHHLHHILQECHWRVQSVDHALCAQSNEVTNVQNQAGNDDSFQHQDGKDCSLNNQSGVHNLQDAVRGNYSKHDEARKDYFQDDSDKQIKVKDPFKKISEQGKDNNLQDNPEDNNHGNETEETESESLSLKDHNDQNSVQEKDSLQDISNEDETLLTDEGTNTPHLLIYSKENFPSQSAKDSGFHKTVMENHADLYNPIPDHCHDQYEKENLLNNTKSTCKIYRTNSFHKQQFRGLIRRGTHVGDDSIPVDSDVNVSAVVRPLHNFGDLSVRETSAESRIMTDDTCCMFASQKSKFFDKYTEEPSSTNLCQSNEVKCRLSHKEGSIRSEVFYEEIDILKNQKTNDALLEDEREKTTDVKRTVSDADIFSEVTQKMDVIWEAFESLHSHFLGLQSSIVDSSSHYLIQKHNRLQDNFDNTSVTLDKVTRSTDINEEHHAMDEDKHQTFSKATQASQSFREQSSHQDPAYGASPNDRTVYKRTFFRSWPESCLCIGMGLLLLLLLLFLASCLLLVLPVVSVSVRTAGGLPAF